VTYAADDQGNYQLGSLVNLREVIAKCASRGTRSHAFHEVRRLRTNDRALCCVNATTQRWRSSDSEI